MAKPKKTGRIIVNPRGFGLLELAGEAGEAPVTAFVSPPDLNPFLEGDRVSARIEEQANGRLSATDIALVERTRTHVFGNIVFHGKRPHIRIDRQVSNTDWPIVFPEGKADAAREGVFYIAEIRGAELVPVREVAEPDASLERVVVRHEIRAEYPEACLSEAHGAKVPDVGTRRDLRNIVTVTIDGPASRDLDDAVAVIPAAADGAMRVLVSIADVDALVPAGSALDREASARATSVYLAGRVLPMIPAELSEDKLSLVEGADRVALTVELRVDSEGQVTSCDLYESLIRSHARLTYDAVTEFLDRGVADGITKPVQETLRWLRTAASRLSAVRASRGGVQLLREEAHVTLDEITREPTKIDARISSTAHELIERLMVAANEAVASWLVERGLPGVFRVHDEPEPERVAALADFAKNFGFYPGFGAHLTPRGLAAFEAQFKDSIVAPAMSTVLGKALGSARYTVYPSPHFGLAAPLYLHFTSPIRRYADLAVHRIVKHYLAGGRDHHAGDPKLEELAHYLNRTSLRATKAEAERLRMIAARLFASRVGEKLFGNIVAIQPFGLVVQLAGMGVSGTVAQESLAGGPFRVAADRNALIGETRTYGIGEPMNVEVAGANEDLGRIDLIPRA